MTLITTARASTTAGPDRFFETWADTDNWPAWNTDIEWVRRDGPFTQGATGRLKPKGGPAVRYTIETLTADRFLDVSRLPGARLAFDHRLTTEDGKTTIEVEISLTGPLAGLWRRLMGGGIAKAAQPDLDNLIRQVER